MHKLIVASLFFAAAHAYCGDLSEEYNSQIAKAEADGKALFAAFSGKDAQKPLQNEDINFIRNQGMALCDGKYSVVSVPGTKGASNSRYLILAIPTGEGIPVGRHFRIETEPNSDQILSAAASSKGCVTIPPPPSGVKAMAATVTHLLSPTPTEFHVFLNLYYQTTLYVGTNYGTWVVKDGAIQLVKKTG